MTQRNMLFQCHVRPEKQPAPFAYLEMAGDCLVLDAHPGSVVSKSGILPVYFQFQNNCFLGRSLIAHVRSILMLNLVACSCTFPKRSALECNDVIECIHQVQLRTVERKG